MNQKEFKQKVLELNGLNNRSVILEFDKLLLVKETNKGFKDYFIYENRDNLIHLVSNSTSLNDIMSKFDEREEFMVKKNKYESTNFDNYCDKLKNICEEIEVTYKKWDLGFTIYPDGYNKDKSDFYFTLIDKENFDYEFGFIYHKKCSDEELKNYLKEFKNGVINKDFSNDNVIISNKEEQEFVFEGL